MRIFSVIILGLFTGCYVSKNPVKQEAIRLKHGQAGVDTSYVYALPYEAGKSFRVIQGYFSQFTHKERAALDFNMKTGTAIMAAREGVVMRVKKDGKRGGLKDKYRSQGNHIIIQHDDGSRAGYWHLQYDGIKVEVGDTVSRGQLLGYSGKTGYAIIPHLHFLVWRNRDNQWQPVPTRFNTSSGIRYLSFWGKYRKPVKKDTLQHRANVSLRQ